MGSHREQNAFISFVKDLFQHYWLAIFLAAIFILCFAVALHNFVG